MRSLVPLRNLFWRRPCSVQRRQRLCPYVRHYDNVVRQLGTTTNWTFGIVIGQFVPVAQDALGFGLFYIFAGFCVLMVGFTTKMVPVSTIPTQQPLRQPQSSATILAVERVQCST